MWNNIKIGLTGIAAAAFLLFATTFAFTQETCPEGRDFESVTQNYLLASGTTEYREMKGEFVGHFAKAFTEVTGNPTPEGMDHVQLFHTSSMSLLVAYKNRCALGSAAVPNQLLETILMKMRENRAQN